MNYLFETNMQLINIVNDLKNKYEELETKTNSLLNENQDFKESFDQVNKDLQSKVSINEDIHNLCHSKSEIAYTTIPNNDITYLENKLVKLEQCEANKYIVFQGNKVDELIAKSRSDKGENIDDVLKSYLTFLLYPDSTPILEEILSVKTYGRDRKILKVELSQKIKKEYNNSCGERKKTRWTLHFGIPCSCQIKIVSRSSFIC